MPGQISASDRAIIALLLETDADLRQEARGLVLDGLRDLRNIQQRGDPAIRARLAIALAGPITKAIFEAGDDDGNSELRQEMHDMMAEMRGDIMGEDDVTIVAPVKKSMPA